MDDFRAEEVNKKTSLEKLDQRVTAFDDQLNTIKEEMEVYKSEADTISKDVKKQYDLILALKENQNTIVFNTSVRFKEIISKQSVVYKLLQHRLIPIDTLIEQFNQNFKTGVQSVRKLETLSQDFINLSNDFYKLDSRVNKRYACHCEVRDNTPVFSDNTISTFRAVIEYNGQHFNKTTGKFVSPHDGLYLVCVTLHEWGDHVIHVEVWAGSQWRMTVRVGAGHTCGAGSVVFDMKKNDELYFYVDDADDDAKLTCYSSFTIVSL
ncbi:uncharacterized protein LOC131947363 [Physella acuta]|uniref:uncharacterized protein LOC131947363 n=1 Tax=Physella acuta TaxID=109671 RepID=UPI0027DE0106|nr:uncharacterized protein LOC131947363 [Physella acuta]XP_059164550.1 uncharacterized protein LOC131947363 [Physella acuta]